MKNINFCYGSIAEAHYLEEWTQMVFERKVFSALLEWKKQVNGSYAALLEGARRVGKSTIAEEFAKKYLASFF